MRVFKEQQRFTQPWLIIVLAISFLVVVSLILKEYISEDSEMRAVEVVTTIATFLAAILPIFFLKLKTRIDEKGIHYQFSPLHLKQRTIAWSELKSAETRKYDAISEFGGWGIKGGFLWKKSKGVAYNVSGDIGIQLEFKNGKKILIGTKLLNEANSVLKTYKEKIHTDEN